MYQPILDHIKEAFNILMATWTGVSRLLGVV